MQFKLGMSSDNTFVEVKVTCLEGLSLELALRFTKEYTRYGQEKGILKCLIDMQGIRSTEGIVGKYSFAYSGAEDAGLSRDWRIALLKDAEDKTPEFLETVMLNAGYTFKVFDDKSVAQAWLLKIK